MRIMILFAASALLLAGCTPARVASAGDAVAQADGRIDQAEAAYLSAKLFAEILLPFFSAERASQVRAIGLGVERALAAARAATTAAALAIALEKARAGTARITEATGAPAG